ncbi:GbsR/MarR family transcriptional regulator [Salsuginibacillus kocurii]|uniref:GbsR/MarR family transcriptional regulator n=1 Tax=Salsuginibacillus kocurii TaxID=427078 RepID=UPI00036079E9|nr:hypothetical protein [Salsuginibacillus kocurii]
MKDADTEQHTLEEIRTRFISVMAKNMEVYGISETVGRLYGTVYFHDQPMTLDEMSASLCMSKTSMSTNIKILSEANMVERVWQKGVRKDLYQDEDDWYKSFTTVFIDRWRSATNANLESAEHTKKELQAILDKTNDSMVYEKAATDLSRVEKALDYYAWLDEIIHLFETEQIFDYVNKK